MSDHPLLFVLTYAYMQQWAALNINYPGPQPPAAALGSLRQHCHRHLIQIIDNYAAAALTHVRTRLRSSTSITVSTHCYIYRAAEFMIVIANYQDGSFGSCSGMKLLQLQAIFTQQLLSPLRIGLIVMNSFPTDHCNNFRASKSLARQSRIP